MKLASRVQVLDSPTRCPYCHEHVEVEREAWVVCRSCLARHHQGCWQGDAECATCGRTEFLSPRANGHTQEKARLADLGQAPKTGLSVMRALREGAALYERPGFGLIFLATAVTSLLTGASFLVLGGLLYAGMWRIFLRSSAREETKLSDLFHHSDRFGPLTGAFFFVSILGLMGMVAGLLPMFLVMAFLGYTIPLMSERGLGFKDALKTSARAAKSGGLGSHLFLALTTFALTLPELIAGALIPGVGDALVGGLLAPLTFGAWVSAYRQVVDAQANDAVTPKE
jgi:hypothetical protein